MKELGGGDTKEKRTEGKGSRKQVAYADIEVKERITKWRKDRMRRREMTKRREGRQWKC